MTIDLKKALETNQLGRFIDEAEADGLGGTVEEVLEDAEAVAKGMAQGTTNKDKPSR